MSCQAHKELGFLFLIGKSADKNKEKMRCIYKCQKTLPIRLIQSENMGLVSIANRIGLGEGLAGFDFMKKVPLGI